MPIVTAGFLLALGYQARFRWARMLTEPWVATALIVLAAGSVALGTQLAAYTDGPLAALTGIVPQVACLVVLGRILAALYHTAQAT